MEFKSKPAIPPGTLPDGVREREFLVETVEDRIIDFLDGKTHGEELLHALYDHVLDEPIPTPMLAVLRK